MYSTTLGTRRYVFRDIKTLLAKAPPLRSGDQLAGLAADNGEERVAAQFALADLPLTVFLNEAVVAYESDEVTRLIVDTHDKTAFAPVAHLTVGGFRDWLLSDEATTPMLTTAAPGITAEMAAAVSKISRLQDRRRRYGALRADCVAVLIGERPGLSAPDGMGAYLTWRPSIQTTDAERNCISNIRPDGVGYEDAAFKLAHLLRAMRARRFSGVRLKDASDRLTIRGP